MSPFKQFARLRKIVQDVRASYWFIPGCLVVISALVAWIAHFAGEDVTDALPLPVALSQISTEGARSLLATIAGSIAGITGVMFSLTLVAVTHAAGQYGPRLIGNFMRDRGNQWSLGILISVFVYAIITLALVSSGEEQVARLSVVLALVLALLGVCTMIFFVHHVPETVNVANIAAQLGRRFDVMLRDQITDREAPGVESPVPDREPDQRLRFPESGYIQAVNYDRIAELAEECDLVLLFRATPGDFVTPTLPFVDIWGTGLSDEAREAVLEAVAIGTEKTEMQTVTFVADQLVEMAALALSPGVNDPFTAINCLNWLSAGLGTALAHDGGLRPHPPGRLHGTALTFDTLYAHTFPAAMPYVIADAMARAAAIALLTDLMAIESGLDRRPVLRDLRRLRAA
ncbi:DUF2254 domain-containing protein [Jannaschia ovalis]|uniref:DUF2254 domain-containing protein n=1 Tax=Jannaschia ovalis TaxID=3038773 RepID=A0ABY8L9B4_9RHOB|nr:DUF2254 domain-containing protein [Jannaschia sp. GRR-S6-38]WGH77701.1 DUF2254 domain-containing protein [Jannaschia sp. GRR-S6-38]